MIVIQDIPQHFVGNKQERKVSLLLDAYIEIPVSCLKTNKLTSRRTSLLKGTHKFPRFPYQADSKS